MRVIYHTDGAAMGFVEGLIDMGIDVLQALQFSAEGMDPHAIKGQFGDRLCFEGGVSVQTTLPFGTAEDVRSEVEELIAVWARTAAISSARRTPSRRARRRRTLWRCLIRRRTILYCDRALKVQPLPRRVQHQLRLGYGFVPDSGLAQTQSAESVRPQGGRPG